MSRENSPSDDRIVTGGELSRCFKELEASLGRSVMETIVYELEIMFGIMLEGRFSYKMSRIDDALRKLLGDSAAEMMMEHILDNLDEKK